MQEAIRPDWDIAIRAYDVITVDRSEPVYVSGEVMRVGPLVTDGAEALVRASGVAGLEPLLERLPDELVVERPGGAEELLVRLRDHG